jgi:hypothetical protein
MNLRADFVLGALLGVAVAGASAQDQTAANAEANAKADRSFYEGKVVEHPEMLSGIWEASNGHGGVVGIQLILTTTIPASAMTLAGTPQSWVHLEVMVYEQVGRTLDFSERNGFSDSVRGGSVQLEDGRLTLHFVSGVESVPKIDLDLKWVDGDAWEGRFHRGSFDSHVTLRRSGALLKSKPSVIAGTWMSEGPGIGSTCLHVAETAPGQFVGWSDSHMTYAHVRFAPNVQRPETAMQHYGDLAKVSPLGDGKFRIELYALSAICCSHPFTATPDESGETMVGDFAAGPNQAPHTSTWKKLAGGSCLDFHNEP